MLKLGKKNGFTLIELLVVIAIITILAALLLPNLIGTSARAREAAAQAEIAQLSTTLERYYADCGAYPPDEPDDSSSALVNALLGDASQKSYYPFRKGKIKNGEYYSPLNYPYLYRENWSEITKTAEMHCLDSFDLWTKNRKGETAGLNSWGGAAGIGDGAGGGGGGGGDDPADPDLPEDWPH